jgi:Family of unknown function (DUF5677)
MKKPQLRMDMETIDAGTDGYYAGLKIVTEYMEKCWNNFPFSNSQTQQRDTCIKTLYGRAILAMRSLEKLDSPSFMQTILAVYRSLFEVTVDLILIHYDKSTLSAEKMLVWAESEAIRGFEEIVEFYQQRGLAIPEKFRNRELSYKTQKIHIDELRKKYWPLNDPTKAKHPTRWTWDKDRHKKHETNFLWEIKQADELHGDKVKEEMDTSLEEIYFTDYRYLSWFVHSNVSSVWNRPPEYYHLECGQAFKKCAELGMLCTEITLNDFGLAAHNEDLKETLKKIKEQRALNVLQRIWAVQSKE